MFSTVILTYSPCKLNVIALNLATYLLIVAEFIFAYNPKSRGKIPQPFC